MNKINTIKALDKKMLAANDSLPFGLADGKIGLCLYCYYMCRLTGNNDYEQKADLLLGDIFKELDNLNDYGIKNGLAGIGLGIDYLIENRYVEGDSNDVLEEVDNMLFKQLVTESFTGQELTGQATVPRKITDTILHIQLQQLYYFSVRLKKQRKGSENEYLYRETVIHTVNRLSETIMPDLFDEPLAFNVEYLPMLYLYALGLCTGLYCNKVCMILKEMSPYILSKIPLLHANRLYLLHAMATVGKTVEMPGWQEHRELLRREVDIARIIESELNGNIYFSNGLPAIYLLLSVLPEYFTKQEISYYQSLIINKIESSVDWNLLLNDNECFKRSNGLYTGYLGTFMLLQKHYRDENKFD